MLKKNDIELALNIAQNFNKKIFKRTLVLDSNKVEVNTVGTSKVVSFGFEDGITVSVPRLSESLIVCCQEKQSLVTGYILNSKKRKYIAVSSIQID